jgi:hypothetical protein
LTTKRLLFNPITNPTHKNEHFSDYPTNYTNYRNNHFGLKTTTFNRRQHISKMIVPGFTGLRRIQMR